MKRLFLKTLITLLVATPLSARITYLDASEVISSDLTSLPLAIFGPPDSPDALEGAGTRWGGLGNGQVVLRFPATTRNGQPIAAGVIRTGRANFILYEHQGGAPEPEKVKVEWRTNFDVDFWIEAIRVDQLEEIPKDNHDPSQKFGYYLNVQEDTEIEVRLTGLSTEAPGQTNASAPGFDLDAVARITRDIPALSQDLFSFTSSESHDIESVRMNDNLWLTVGTRPSSPPTWRLMPSNPRTKTQTAQHQAIAGVFRGDPNCHLRRVHIAASEYQAVVATHYDEKIEFIRFDQSLQEIARVSYPLPTEYQSQSEVAIDLALSPDGNAIALVAGGRGESLLLNLTNSGWQSGQVDDLSFLPSQSGPGAIESVAQSPTVQVSDDNIVYAGLINMEDFGDPSPNGLLTVTKIPLLSGLLGDFSHPLASRQIVSQGFDGAGELDSSLANGRLAVIGGFDNSGEISAIIYQEDSLGTFAKIEGNDDFLGINTKFEIAQTRKGKIYYAYLDHSTRTDSKPSIIFGEVYRGNMHYRILEEGRNINPLSGISLAPSNNGHVVLTIGRTDSLFNNPIGIVTHLVSSDFEDFNKNGYSRLAELAGLPSLTYFEPIPGNHGGRVVLRVPIAIVRDDFSQNQLNSPEFCYVLQKIQNGKWINTPNSRIDALDIFSIQGNRTAIWEMTENPLPTSEIFRVVVERN